MYCNQCGSILSENSKFCHKCGNKIFVNKQKSKNGTETKIVRENKDGELMSLEEYMAHTNIENIDEAKKYLTQLNILFVLVFIGIIFVRGFATIINENIYATVWIIYIVLLIYFVWYCVKVARVEKIQKVSVAFSIIFAPISWLWFYPSITDPLKIAIGKKKPPLKDYFTNKEIMKKTDKKNNFWKWFIIILLISIVVISMIAWIIGTFAY